MSSAVWLRVRHSFAVLALLAAPIAGVVWSFLVPIWTGSMANEVAAVAAAPGRFIAGTYAGVVMSFLLVPMVLVLARLLRPRAPIATDIAAALCIVGACFHGGVLIFQLAETAIIAAVADQAQATSIVTKMFEHRVFFMVLAPFIAFYVGLAAFAVIMLVRRALSPWIPLLILVAIPIELVGPLWKARAFFVMLTIAFTGLAWTVARLGALEWSAQRDVRASDASANMGMPTMAA